MLLDSSRRDIARFDRWSSTYERSFFWRHYFVPLHGFLMSVIGEASGLLAIDIGCGTGAMSRLLAEAGAARVAGVDISKGMLEVARRLDPEMLCEFVFAPAEELPFGDAEFDLALTCIAFHHFNDPAGAIREASRVLRPGGRLIVCDLYGEGLPARIFLEFGRRLRSDERYFTREAVVGMFEDSGMRVTDSERIRRFPPTMLVTGTKT